MDKLELLTDLLGRARVVELSHLLEEDIPVWPTHSRFYKMVWHSPAKGDTGTNHQFIMNEHNGTHVDASMHYFAETGLKIDEMPAASWFGPCCVLHLPDLGKGGVVEPAHIADWEGKNGRIAKGDVVILDYGWYRRWRLMPNHLDYITDYPGLGGEAAEVLRDRGVKLVCSDTLSIDARRNADDPAHHVLLGNGIAIAENLDNLGELPPRCYFLCLPLRIKGGSGSPVRPVALVI